MHVSNLHLNLAPIVGLTADALSKQAVVIESPDDKDRHISSATWVLVGRPEFLGSLLMRGAANVSPSLHVHVWTDDYNNLFQALR